MFKIYLAGPEVFFPDSIEIGQEHKRICSENGFEGLYPLDNVVAQKESKEDTAKCIATANMKLIQECDYILANLSNFRGSKIHPSCDSGTAWECGYGLGLGKVVIAYTDDEASIPKEILHLLSVTIKTQKFEETFKIFNSLILKTGHIAKEIKNPQLYELDPKYNDIKDVNPISAFYLGICCSQGWPCIAQIKDHKSQIEKYGKYDENGNSVEDFNYPVNIMIACNCRLY